MNFSQKPGNRPRYVPPIGIHNGSPNSLLHIKLQPRRYIEKFQHTNSEAIYYVEAGQGKIVDMACTRVITHDSFVFVPTAFPHAIHNTGRKTLEIFLVLTGAGSLEAGI